MSVFWTNSCKKKSKTSEKLRLAVCAYFEEKKCFRQFLSHFTCVTKKDITIKYDLFFESHFLPHNVVFGNLQRQWYKTPA